MTVIIDNASFHKSKYIVGLIEAAGCHVLFLPSYSPDLNPIEHRWATLKDKIRAMKQPAKSFLDAAVRVLAKECTT